MPGGNGPDPDGLPLPGTGDLCEYGVALEYMHLFTATGWTGEPHVCDEGDLAWIKKAELLTLPMWEGDKIFLRLLDSDEPFFSLKLCYAGDRLESAVLNGKQVEL